MATKDKEGEGFMNVSRRDFVKFSAAAAAVGGGWAYNTASALAYENDPTGTYKITNTTCPYCSASCGQRVVVNIATQEVVDIYGDFESPMNAGGLCAKGSGAFQLATNSRRIGAWAGAHPVNSVFAYNATDPLGIDIAYRRIGNGGWEKTTLNAAMADIAQQLVTARGALTETNQSKGVAFLGCSHMNNEPNYLYRKIVANFGTSNVEHQARI